MDLRDANEKSSKLPWNLYGENFDARCGRFGPGVDRSIKNHMAAMWHSSVPVLFPSWDRPGIIGGDTSRNFSLTSFESEL
jgi:hypothetical protein